MLREVQYNVPEAQYRNVADLVTHPKKRDDRTEPKSLLRK